MSELRRLLEDNPSDLERSLLSSASADAPSVAARERAAVALGLVAGASVVKVAASVGAPPLLKALASATWSKVLLGIAAVAVVGAGVAVSLRAQRAPGAGVVSPFKPRQALAPVKDVAADALSTPAPDPPLADPPSAPPHSPPDPLGLELALLERARSALAEHDAHQAGTALDQYRRQFPAGTLFPESQVLRLEVLIESGQLVRARELGERLLRVSPNNPLNSRVRALLANLPER